MSSPTPAPPPPALRIALLEDASEFAEQALGWLDAAGHRCEWQGTVAAFKHMLSRQHFDLALLDRQLPDGSGDEVLTWMQRTLDAAPPAIIITARGGEAEVAQVLDLGAEDYLVKPVRRLELLARVRAVTRRRGGEPPAEAIELGDLRIDTAQRRVHRGGVELALGAKEYAILLLMLRNLGRLLPREQLYEAGWGRPMAGTTRTVDTYVSQVRTKVGLTLERGWRLTSVYQRGYRLERWEPPTAV